MTEFRHTQLISEYDSATGKFINYLELGDTSTTPDTPVDLRFRVPGYIENVHTIYFEGDHGESPEAGISTSKPSGVVHDLVFFDPQNTSGKTLSDLVGGESLWESSTDGETYLTTPEPVNLKGQPLRGSNVTGGDLLLVANSVNSGTIYCQDTLDVQGNDIHDVHDFYMHDTGGSWDYLHVYSPYDPAGGEKLLAELVYVAIGKAVLALNDANLDMLGNEINGVDVIKANDIDGIDCCYSGGTNMLYIATSSYAFSANANANMNTHSIINVNAISGTYNSTSTYDELSIRNQANSYDIAIFGSSGSGESISGFLDMKDHHIANVLAADDVAHAVNLGQLGYASPDGWVAGDLLYASSSNTLVRLPSSGAASKVLTMKADETAPEWMASSSFTCADLNSCHVTDLTDVSSAGSHNIITDTERTKLNGINTSLYMLLSVYDPGSDGVVIPTAGGTGLGSGLNAYETGDILYASAANILGRRAHGEENQVLTMNSSLLPVWANPSGGTGLWESPAGETYLTTPEPINLQGQDIRDMFNFYMHEGGTWDYLNIYNPDGDKQLIQLMSYGTIAASLNLAGADLNMVSNAINGVNVIKANDEFGVKFKQSNTDDIRLYAAWAGYAFVANANANMNTHNIINVAEIKGTTDQDIYVKPLGTGILYLG